MIEKDLPTANDPVKPVKASQPVKQKELSTKDKLNQSGVKFANETANKVLEASTVINPSMYDKKIEKLQSYGSKWNNYGYSSKRDNEKVYDELTSNSEQWGRSIVGASKLAVIGFNDSALFGAFADSKKNADSFGQIADIYSTQRGGVTGFTQNLALNAGYTMGIMADMVAEEAALALITAASFGTAAPITGSAMVAKGLKAFGQIGKSFDKMNDLKKAINAADKASDLSRLRKVGNKVGNFLNPLEHSTKYIKALKEVKSVKDLSSLGKIAHGGAAIFRDVKAMQLAYSEANLEANMLQKDMYDEAIKENPYMTEEDSKVLNKNIDDAKQYTKLENVVGIFATNKLVFNNMYKKFDDLKGVSKFLSTGKFGRLASVPGGVSTVRSGNVFQKGFYQGFADSTKLLFEKGALGALGKVGKTAVGKSGKYLASNIGEGIQETFQETVQATNKYAFGSKAQGTYYDAVLHGLKEQISQQGGETFLSGFLMGGLISPVTSIISGPVKFIKQKDYKQFTNKASFKQSREQALEELKQDADIINQGYSNVGAILNGMGNNVATQSRLDQEMTDAAAEGDRYTFQGKKDESYRNHLHTMMKHGVMSDFIENLEGFKSMTPKEASDAFGLKETISPAEIEKMVNSKITRAKKFQTIYTDFKSNYTSPINTNKLDKADPNYNELMTYHSLWNHSVDNLIFNTNEFEENLDRKMDLTGAVAAEFDKRGISYTDYSILTSPKQLQEEVSRLSLETKGLSSLESTPEIKLELKTKNDKLRNLMRYQEALGEHTRVLSRINELNALENPTAKNKKELKQKEKHLGFAATRMLNRHNVYLKSISANDKGTAFDAMAQKTFDKLYDYYKLNDRNVELQKSIDVLSNDSLLHEIITKANAQRETFINSHKAYVTNSIAKFRDSEHINIVIKELLDQGIAFNLKELDALIEKGILPKTFFDVEKNEVLKVSDPKYKIAVKTLNELVDNLIEQPILERDDDIYTDQGRGAVTKDEFKSTYSELAKEYGFDVSETQKTKDVLNVIIKSENSTDSEKELAKVLLNLVSDTDTVTFSDSLSGPNELDSSGKSLIDARYSSSNFTNSLYSLEESILKNEMQKLTEKALTEDEEFNKQVSELREQVDEFIKKNNEENKDDPTKIIKRSWKGLNSNVDFIKESFANHLFQKVLVQVTSTKKTDTAWSKFVDSVVNLFNSFNIKNGLPLIQNNVYNEIVSIVELKIKTENLEEPVPVKNPVPTPSQNSGVTNDEVQAVNDEETDENDEDEQLLNGSPKALIDLLIEAYKNAVSKGDAVGRDLDTLTNRNFTREFEDWVDNNGGPITEDYYDKNSEIETNAKSLNPEMLSKLLDQDYTVEEINAMSAGKLKRLILEQNDIPSTNQGETIIDSLIENNINTDDTDSKEETGTESGTTGTSNTDGNETTEEETGDLETEEIGEANLLGEVEAEKADIKKKRRNEINKKAPYVIKIIKQEDNSTIYSLNYQPNGENSHLDSYAESIQMYRGKSDSKSEFESNLKRINKNISDDEINAAYDAQPIIDSINAKYDKELAELDKQQKVNVNGNKTTEEETRVLETTEEEIEARRKEELDTQTTAGYGVIASDYLFTGGRGVILSTDYLLQALTASYPFAGKQIDIIRNKYASKLGNIRDDINTENYISAMQEIRKVITETYNNKNAEIIFDKIINNSTGFISREGNQVSSELDKINEEHEGKINAKYDKKLAALNNQQKENVNGNKTTKSVRDRIKNKSLFLEDLDENGNRVIDKDGNPSQSVGEMISQSDAVPVPTAVIEINGIEFVEFSNPETGDLDVVVTGKNDGSYVGYYRLYENGKPTNKWSSKFENPSRNKEDFKTMMSGVQSMLPAGHEYTEKTSISTDGLRVWAQQLNRGYELQYDEKGNIITNTVAINGDAIVNELGIPVVKGNFQNIEVNSQEDFNKVRDKLLPYLEAFGLKASDIKLESGTVKISLPVLKKTTTTNNRSETTEETTSAGTFTPTERFTDSEGNPIPKGPEVTTSSEAPITEDSGPKVYSSMREELIDRLTLGEEITSTSVVVPTNALTLRILTLSDGRKVNIYDHRTEKSYPGDNFKLVLVESVTTDKGVVYKNVIQVYMGDTYIGNVAIDDYVDPKPTITKTSTEADIREVAEEIVDSNPEVIDALLNPNSEGTTEALKLLKYTAANIAQLSDEEKVRIVAGKISKKQYVKEKKDLEKLVPLEKTDIEKEITTLIDSKIDSIKTEADISTAFGEVVYKHSSEENRPFIIDAFNKIRETLAKQKDFTKLTKGDILLMTDGSLVKVVSANKKEIKVVAHNSILSSKTTILKDNFDNSVSKVINDFNKNDADLKVKLDQTNIDDLSEILRNFTPSALSETSTEIEDKQLEEHFKNCK